MTIFLRKKTSCVLHVPRVLLNYQLKTPNNYMSLHLKETCFTDTVCLTFVKANYHIYGILLALGMGNPFETILYMY